MISNSLKRNILRWVHLIVVIPIFGYIYGDPAEVAQYADGVRFLFVPVNILAGYWMWRGYLFALIGVALWIAAVYFAGFGTALLGQIALFIAWKIWLVVRARRVEPVSRA
jgi:hypothetical protein